MQYLPLPVVGGYLGFVGYFCVASGTGLGVSKDIGTISRWGGAGRRPGSWVRERASGLAGGRGERATCEMHVWREGMEAIGPPWSSTRLPAPAPGPCPPPSHLCSWVQLADWVALGKLVPTLGACAAMMLTHSRVAHPLGLPAVMAAIVLAFHATLLALGVSLERAQELGWAMRATVRLRWALSGRANDVELGFQHVRRWAARLAWGEQGTLLCWLGMGLGGMQCCQLNEPIERLECDHCLSAGGGAAVLGAVGTLQHPRLLAGRHLFVGCAAPDWEGVQRRRVGRECMGHRGLLCMLGFLHMLQPRAGNAKKLPTSGCKTCVHMW